MNVQRKSITTPEMYFHVRPAQDEKGNGGTVYCRQGKDGVWWGAASHISANDTFNRKVGRTVAKRHFAAGKVRLVTSKEEPTYEDAYNLFNATRN